MREKFSFIELFAGCGGMSLGLEAAGFDFFFANELSPMAGETFAYNLLKENLSEAAAQGKKPKNVIWLKSAHPISSLKNRLRESPSLANAGRFTDLGSDINLHGKLLIGNINELLTFLETNKRQAEMLRKSNVGLLSGGPPCQSFSLAGLRVKDDKKNLLPHSFAKVAGIIKPKVVLLENVKGITSPFTVRGVKYYAWLEVSKAFALQGYVPICMMVNSKFFNVPQNRPRFILLGIRIDLFKKIKKDPAYNTAASILANSKKFYNLCHAPEQDIEKLNKESLALYDIEKCPHLFDGLLLPKIVSDRMHFVSAIDAIDDLSTDGETKNKPKVSKYVTSINKVFGEMLSPAENLKNHDQRAHSIQVRARFRWFQIVNNLNGLAPYAYKLTAGHIDNQIAKAIFQKVKPYRVLLVKEGIRKLKKLKSEEEFFNYISDIQTKKHSQRALKPNEPAPAQMTIPDDMCHYSESSLRTMTVREMARLQSFPDNFIFRSKITTGGQQRSFEVPQYTQVGNAVPPFLAYHLGILVKNLLNANQDAE